MFGVSSGFLAGDGMGFIANIMSRIEHSKVQQRLIDAGVNTIDGLKGIEILNIPHLYHSIEINSTYFHCYIDGIVTVYSEAGKLLFSCTHVKYCKYGMFLVGNKPDNTHRDVHNDEFGYSLYNEGNKLTEAIFRGSGISYYFNDFGFSVLGLFDKQRTNYDVVVNRLGEILLKSDSFDHLYLSNVICSKKDGYFNLLNGSFICAKGYRSNMSTDEFLFIQVDSNLVYQISKLTGEFTIHGKVKEVIASPEIITHSRVAKATEPLPKKQSRNELCNCGSGIKYKNCCIVRFINK